MKNEIAALRNAGFALHLLRPRTKRPYAEKWSTAPVATADELLAAYRPGDNIGVRLGEPSAMVGGGYLHCFDLDIRLADAADEAWEAFARLGIDRTALPTVVSGSGGESRHLYFITDKPFFGKKLAVSEGRHRRFDKDRGKHVLSYDWEIELFGTGKQVVVPPSLHPDTGKPYAWLQPFDFDMLDLGIGPFIPSALIEALGAADSDAEPAETREPLDFKPGQLEREVAEIPLERIDDYHDWVTLGQALHHQFGASDEGFQIWLAASKRSEKFGGERDLRMKWRGFGRTRRQQVTMASIRQWVQEARAAALVDELDDLDDLGTAPEPQKSAGSTDPDDLLGTASDEGDIDDAVAALMKETDEDKRLSWVSLLDINEEGGIKATLHNLRLIVENDTWTQGVMAFNEFTQEVVQRGTPGVKPDRRRNQAKPTLQLTGASWQLRDPVNGDFWTEDKDNAIRALIESPKTQGGYGIKVPDRDLRAAIDIVGRKNGFHPVREYLSGLKWDGESRVERLFIDYLGAPDDAYTRSVASLMMTAAVARVFEPGIKFDFAVILQGLQGRRKSTFINVLAKSWFAELEGDFDDPKQMVEMMQGAWILEMPELGGFVRADVRHIKAFVSRRSDKVRLAYAKRAQEYHRQCIFIGSTNDDKFLKDDTGNRRFWPIRCGVDSIDTDRLEQEVDQLWGEALHLYRAMRAAKPRGGLPLYLTDENAQSIAARLQESARVESADDAIAGQIEAWLDKPIASGDIAAPEEGTLRLATCLKELWVDCLGNDSKTYNQQAAQMLGRAMSRVDGWLADGDLGSFAKWGRQRAYRRISRP